MAIGHGDVLDTPVTTADVGLQRKGRERRGNMAENVNLSVARWPGGECVSVWANTAVYHMDRPAGIIFALFPVAPSSLYIVDVTEEYK